MILVTKLSSGLTYLLVGFSPEALAWAANPDIVAYCLDCFKVLLFSFISEIAPAIASILGAIPLNTSFNLIPDFLEFTSGFTPIPE